MPLGSNTETIVSFNKHFMEVNKKCHKNAVLRIRIHMFLGLPDPDPDPLVRGMDPDPDTALDPDPDPSIIMLNSKKNLDSYYFVTLLTFYL